MERYWLIYDGIGSVEGSTSPYLVVMGQKKAILVDMMVLGQYGALLVGTWWQWINIRQ